MRTILFGLALLLVLTSPICARISSSTTIEGAFVTFSMESYRFPNGEPMSLSLNVVNQSQSATEIRCSGPVYEFWVTNEQGSEVWRHKGEPLMHAKAIKFSPLESKMYRATWNQTGRDNKGVKSGWYNVYAKFVGNTSEVMHLRVRIEEEQYSSPVVIIVPITGGTVNPSTDIGKPISIEGILRQGPQGLYIEVRNVDVRR